MSDPAAKDSSTANTDASQVFEVVKSIVVDQLSVEAATVKPESNFQNDLGADSLDIVELVMALEEKFDLVIPDEAAEGITTVGEAVSYIQTKLSEKQADDGASTASGGSQPVDGAAALAWPTDNGGVTASGGSDD